jgi:hypothetical protein
MGTPLAKRLVAAFIPPGLDRHNEPTGDEWPSAAADPEVMNAESLSRRLLASDAPPVAIHFFIDDDVRIAC